MNREEHRREENIEEKNRGEEMREEKREAGCPPILSAPTQYEVGGLHSLGKLLHNICPIGS